MGDLGQPRLAAVIITRNESLDIAACIESCSFAEKVFVLDSLSTDDTAARARAAGADVQFREFTNYADQQNVALSLVADFDWVLMMDADERVPKDMASEVRAVVCDASDDIVLYRIRRKDFFFGRWLRCATGYPTWSARLMRPVRVHFTRDINEELVAHGKTAFLSTHFHHFPFSKGISAWFERHNSYSTMEAIRLGEEQSSRIGWRLSDLGDPARRRRVAKQVFYRLPCRPLIAFLGLYLLRGGFLDGWAGLQYCRPRSMYEYMIALKMHERRFLAAARRT
ncbi:MAG: glycosyltransferase family 2 protein [Planctomycetaceae bacterium]|jgi:glycosyltransferase involved in cell wall biosynthesis|nr:glycosyltransferase family 2 protein [Planctomycetaceae bacterium]